MTAEQHDPVAHPAHYVSHPSGVECIVVTEHYPFNVGNAIKYLWRSGLKGGGNVEKAVEDLRKAAWYASREADRIEAGEQAKSDAAIDELREKLSGEQPSGTTGRCLASATVDGVSTGLCVRPYGHWRDAGPTSFHDDGTRVWRGADGVGPRS